MAKVIYSCKIHLALENFVRKSDGFLLFHEIDKDDQSLENGSGEGESNVLVFVLALMILFKQNSNCID